MSSLPPVANNAPVEFQEHDFGALVVQNTPEDSRMQQAHDETENRAKLKAVFLKESKKTTKVILKATSKGCVKLASATVKESAKAIIAQRISGERGQLVATAVANTSIDCSAKSLKRRVSHSAASSAETITDLAKKPLEKLVDCIPGSVVAVFMDSKKLEASDAAKH